MSNVFSRISVTATGNYRCLLLRSFLPLPVAVGDGCADSPITIRPSAISSLSADSDICFWASKKNITSRSCSRTSANS